MVFVFDIDGTLTPSRQKMDSEFLEFMLDFADKNNVWLITGSDLDKTIQQIGLELWEKVDRAYQLAGNELWVNGVMSYTNRLVLPDDYKAELNRLVETSQWKEHYGNHIEERGALVNFSVVGRDCTQEQREAYYKWDQQSNERSRYVKYLNEKFPDYEISKGGEISMDIYPKGRNKGQIVDKLEGERFIFFGDQLVSGGNDKPIFDRIKETNAQGKCIQVENWMATYDFLKNEQYNNIIWE